MFKKINLASLSIKSSNFNKLSKFSFSSFGFKYPDVIISEVKESLSKDQSIDTLEEDIITNLHFFDSDQYTDLMTLLGVASKGSADLWHFLEKKVFDYELNFIQVRDIYNANVENPKASQILSHELNRYITSKIGDTSNERATYDLLVKH